jgi:hypothetical protein
MHFKEKEKEKENLILACEKIQTCHSMRSLISLEKMSKIEKQPIDVLLLSTSCKPAKILSKQQEKYENKKILKKKMQTIGQKG